MLLLSRVATCSRPFSARLLLDERGYHSTPITLPNGRLTSGNTSARLQPKRCHPREEAAKAARISISATTRRQRAKCSPFSAPRVVRKTFRALAGNMYTRTCVGYVCVFYIEDLNIRTWEFSRGICFFFYESLPPRQKRSPVSILNVLLGKFGYLNVKFAHAYSTCVCTYFTLRV